MLNYKKTSFSLSAVSLSLALAFPAQADQTVNSLVDIGVVLDGHYQNNERFLGHRDEGFGLGHSELMLSGNIDTHFRGALVAVLGSHGGETELELEEAYIESLSMPWGTKIKAGRFLSNIGYMNSKHLHEDAFIERPAVYRAFFGSHYFDDGAQISWLAPTDFYLQLSTEALSGAKLDSGYDDPATVGVYTANVQIGHDLGVEHSWKLGLSALFNGNGKKAVSSDSESHTHAHAHHGSHDHGHEHTHHHGPSYTSEKMLGVDATWKWAPNGNYKETHLRFTSEYWYMDDMIDDSLTGLDNAKNTADGWYSELAYQLTPKWSLSTRYSQMSVVSAEDLHAHGTVIHGHFKQNDVKEIDVALDWHPSHFGRIRAQITHEEQNQQDQHIFSLQYVMSFGAHGAHAF